MNLHYCIGALSVNATVSDSMELVAVLGPVLLQKCGGDVAYLILVVGSSFCTQHIDMAYV